MNDPRLFKQSGIVEANLKDARRYLVASSSSFSEVTTSLDQFDEFLDHNELGLALQEIAAIGENHLCKAAFWRRLEQAALAMEQVEIAAEFHKKFLATVSG